MLSDAGSTPAASTKFLAIQYYRLLGDTEPSTFTVTFPKAKVKAKAFSFIIP